MADEERKAQVTFQSGVRMPGFLQAFPKDARLQVLVDAYLRGDYGAIRSGAPTLRKEATEPAVREAADELLRRITPHPVLRWMFLATFLLILFVGVYWMRHKS